MAFENNPTPSVVATSLIKSYPHGQAGVINVLNSLDLIIHQGEQVAITGASGSGKSTLLQILAGLERSDSGTVSLLEKSMHQMKDQALARFRNHHLGFVYQFHHLIDDFTALENVALPARIKGLTTAAANNQAMAILAQMGLSARLSHFPWQLSGGERQRCAIARALINQPEIIFADEPTGNLDHESAQQVSDLMMSLCRLNGATLILVTHNPHLAGQTDRQLTLVDGALR
ncbi:MAG: ABC transporter ATP-binding protein [Gammaproteobacteria bacterium]|jgi:lipoprotein-releasing system ATP-binding protein|nr:ABC transporter ATP-binding protein [Gammaproteobacteria bacterium]